MANARLTRRAIEAFGYDPNGPEQQVIHQD